jgi:Tfp pilus assembly protein PilX
MKARAHTSHRSQRGAALFVAMIMLVLTTVMVASAFSVSMVNTRSVGNMQTRTEAVAAANRAIEQVLASPFSDAPAAESIDVDLDNDGVTEYQVDFAVPTCVSATQIAAVSPPPSSLTLGTAFTTASSSFYRTVWDLDATVTHEATGTSVHVRQGVRVLLTQTQFTATCS